MKQQWEKDAKQIAKYYTDKLSEKGFTPEALAAREKKYENLFLESLFEGIEITNHSSFLDIGSGLGLLIPFLESGGIMPKDYLVLVSRVSNYETYLFEFIKKMVKHSNKHVLFNIITKIDITSQNYNNTKSIGGVTSIDRTMLESILNSIEGITYKIIEKRVFEDATDAFVQIKVQQQAVKE
ncbi:MAG: hypothetical protein UT66_C0050G0002 [candidate division CPR2 bacterium GW2011_GWC1_39_9]|nr:MAG: hypothetical protein UT66_C0050G0002 [candidate division CPR2 bacterium GW2011_GWC1_39_9]